MKKFVSILTVPAIVCTMLPAAITAEASGNYNLTLQGQVNYDFARQVVELVNQERAAHGVAALQIDKDLTDAGMQRAAETSIVFDHTRPNGQQWYTLTNKLNGENIAYGAVTPEGIFNQWKNSSAHYQNMMNPDFKMIGVGCWQSGGGTMYWTQEFGRGTNIASDNRNGTELAGIDVEIKNSPYDLAFDMYDDNLQLKKGDSVVMPIRFGSSYVAPQSFNWSSTNPNCVTVDADGVITAVGGGSAYITAVAKNGDGYLELPITVEKTISDVDIQIEKSHYSYTGSEIRPPVTVTFDGKKLTEGTDYTLIYEDNIMPGTARVTVTGIRGLSGSVTKTFIIDSEDISSTLTVRPKDTIDNSISDWFSYVRANYEILIDGADFDDWYVSEVKGTENGVIAFTVKACGIYNGEITYEIAPDNGLDVTVKVAGDVNDDKKVDIKDVIRLQRLLNGETFNVESNPDVNGDGSINIKDVIRMQVYLNGENVAVFR